MTIYVPYTQSGYCLWYNTVDACSLLDGWVMSYNIALHGHCGELDCMARCWYDAMLLWRSDAMPQCYMTQCCYDAVLLWRSVAMTQCCYDAALLWRSVAMTSVAMTQCFYDEFYYGAVMQCRNATWRSVDMTQYCYSAVMLWRSVTMTQCCYDAALLWRSVAMTQRCYDAALLWRSVAMTQCCYDAVSRHIYTLSRCTNTVPFVADGTTEMGHGKWYRREEGRWCRVWDHTGCQHEVWCSPLPMWGQKMLGTTRVWPTIAWAPPACRWGFWGCYASIILL